MIDYNSFRHFADSWGLLYMLIVFIGGGLVYVPPWGKRPCESCSRNRAQG